MDYIISTHGVFTNTFFIIPTNVEIRFYVLHTYAMSMGDGYRLFRSLFLSKAIRPVEIKGPNENCCDYLLTKDNWDTLIINSTRTTQDVNGVFEILGYGNLQRILDEKFNIHGQAMFSDIVKEISLRTCSAVIHCLFCRSL